MKIREQTADRLVLSGTPSLLFVGCFFIAMIPLGIVAVRGAWSAIYNTSGDFSPSQLTYQLSIFVIVVLTTLAVGAMGFGILVSQPSRVTVTFNRSDNLLTVARRYLFRGQEERRLPLDRVVEVDLHKEESAYRVRLRLDDRTHLAPFESYSTRDAAEELASVISQFLDVPIFEDRETGDLVGP
ncbi:MAG: hypothetical protein RMK84_09410 [Oscillochloridaceae bacterium]|nr:DUF4564 domain-containing protein [Chloroflexaceae bacterium]MDW8390331.1 hypothetical protein [Oscillochloridaceae bacterium]